MKILILSILLMAIPVEVIGEERINVIPQIENMLITAYKTGISAGIQACLEDRIAMIKLTIKKSATAEQMIKSANDISGFYESMGKSSPIVTELLIKE